MVMGMGMLSLDIEMGHQTKVLLSTAKALAHTPSECRNGRSVLQDLCYRHRHIHRHTASHVPFSRSH